MALIRGLSMKPAKARVRQIINILHKAYPTSCTTLGHKSPFELLIATILSAQCTDERVNKITPALFKKYKGPSGFARAKQKILEKKIYSIGFYRNKSKNIINTSKMIMNKFNGTPPDSMSGLLMLPGVARKTANIVLSNSFKIAEGIAVDTHVKRLSGRLGLSCQKNPDKIEKDLMKIIPRRDWLDFNHLLVDHGRKICTARKPLCSHCPIKQLCPSMENFRKAI